MARHLAFGPADSFGDGFYFAVTACVKGKNSISFTQLIFLIIPLRDTSLVKTPPFLPLSLVQQPGLVEYSVEAINGESPRHQVSGFLRPTDGFLIQSYDCIQFALSPNWQLFSRSYTISGTYFDITNYSNCLS